MAEIPLFPDTDDEAPTPTFVEADPSPFAPPATSAPVVPLFPDPDDAGDPGRDFDRSEAVGQTPAEHKRLNSLSQATGLPVPVVAEDDGALERAVKKQEADDTIASSPDLQRFLNTKNPEAFKFTHTGLTQLKELALQAQLKRHLFQKYLRKDGLLGDAQNLLMGVSENAMGVLGALGRGAETLLFEPLETVASKVEEATGLNHIQLNFTGEGSPVEILEEPREASLNSEEAKARVARFENFSLGYAPGTTIDDVIDAPLANVLPFMLETGIVSLPEMGVAMASLPAYVAVLTGRIGQDRAENNGRADATLKDMLEAAPPALAISMLERLGLKGMLGVGKLKSQIINRGMAAGARRGFAEVAKAGAKETVTEFLQESGEELASTAGTNKGIDWTNVGKAGLGGAIGGFGMGVAVRSGTVAYELGADARENRAFGDELMNNIASAQMSVSNAEALTKMTQVASDLRELDPELFGEYQGDVMRDRGIDEVSITLEGLNEFQQAGGDVSFLTELGLDEEGKMTAGSVLGDSVVLTPEQFSSLPAETQAALVDHISLNDGMTQKDAKTFLSEGIQGALAEATAYIEGLDVEAKSDAEAVQASMERMLIAEGQAPRTAALEALYVAHGFTAQAEARGQGETALELFERANIQVIGAGAAGVDPDITSAPLIGADGEPAPALSAQTALAAIDLANSREGRALSLDEFTEREQAVFRALDVVDEAGNINADALVDYVARIEPDAFDQSRIPGTSAFAEWFGNSKVVDEAGAPLVVYHGTVGDIEAFDPARIGQTFGFDTQGFFFSNNPGVEPGGASDFAGRIGSENSSRNVMPVYLSIQNPYTLEQFAKDIDVTVDELVYYDGDPQPTTMIFDESRDEIMDKVRAGGYDGVIFSHTNDGVVDGHYVAFEPTQIKSVFNNGAYSPTDANILNQSSVPLQSRALKIQGTGPNGRITNWDFGEAMTERHTAKHGRVLDPATSEEDYKTVLADFAREYRNQLTETDTGHDWYVEDIAAALDITQNILPDLDPANTNRAASNRDLFLTVAALLSPQQKPRYNWENAILASQGYFDTGTLAYTKPNGKNFGVASHGTGLKLFQYLIDKHGQEGAIEWLRTPHTGKELAEVRRDSGLFKGGDTSRKLNEYLASETNLTDTYLGIAMMGPKVGEFMQNATGFDQEAVTVDLWLARTYNRHVGRLLDVGAELKKKKQIASELRGKAERDLIKKIVRDLAKQYDLQPSAMQAAMWYYEQRLFRNHGINSDSQNFSGAAQTAAEARSISVPRASADAQGVGEDQAEATEQGGVGQTFNQAHPQGSTRKNPQGELFLGAGIDRALEPAKNDPEGRSIIANVVAGVQDESGRDVNLTSEELVTVADALADGLYLFHHRNSHGTARIFQKHFGTARGSRMSEGTSGTQVATAKEGKTGAEQEGILMVKDSLLPEMISNIERGTYFRSLKNWENALEANGKGRRVFAHELGHLIDLRMAGTPEQRGDNLDTRKLDDQDGVSERITTELIEKAGLTKEIVDDMVKLSKAFRPEFWNFENRKEIEGKFHEVHRVVDKKDVDEYIETRARYMYSFRELTADTIGLYMTDPKAAKALGPAAAKWVRDQVNDNPAVNGTVQFNQSGFQQSARASISFEAERTIIKLGADADRSSFLHEVGHLWLENLKANAAELGATRPQIQKDWDTVTSWWSKNSDLVRREAIAQARDNGRDDLVPALEKMSEAALQRRVKAGDLTRTPDAEGFVSVAMHELWARGHEDYLRTGTAPSVALQDAFNRFRAWMVSLYKAIERRIGRDLLDVTFSPDVRAVMDRLVATEEEIAIVSSQFDMKAMFASEDEFNGSPAQFEAYQRDVARANQEAKNTQLKKHMAEVEREKLVWWKEEKAKIEEEVMDEMNLTPEYRLLYGLAKGTEPDGTALDVRPERMDKKTIDAVLEETGAWKTLPRVGGQVLHATKTGETTVHPDVVADHYGFASAEDMFAALTSVTPLEIALADEADARMKERHGNLEVDDQAIEAAIESVHGDKRGAVLLSELKQLNQSGEVMKPAFVKAWAAEQLGKQKVDDLTPQRFLTLEKKYGREANKQMRAGNIAAAQQAKFRQTMNFYMAQGAYKARAQVQADRTYMRKFNSRRRDYKTIDADYVDKIKLILSAYDLGPRISDARLLKAELAALHDWIQEQNTEGEGALIDVPPSVLLVPEGTHYRDLTLDEFQTLADSIRNLEAQGRLKKSLRIKGENKAIDDVVKDIADRLENNRDIRKVEANRAIVQDPTWWDKKKLGASSFDASLRKVEFLLEKIDGEKLGTAHQAIFQPIADAEAEKNDIVKDINTVFMTKLDALPKEVKRKLGRAKMIPSLGRKMSRGNLLMLALNVGNESNLDKTIRGSQMDGGQSWTEEGIDEALQDLTKEEWDFVQSVWEAFSSMKGRVEEVYRRENGRAPEMIQGRPIATKFGVIQGDYFPMMYDPGRSVTAQDIENKNALEVMQGQAAQGSVFDGMTKGRTGFAAPVLLDLERMPQQIVRTAHFITHYEAVRSIKKILARRDFQEAVTSRLGKAYYDELKHWLSDVAADGKEGKPLSAWDKAVMSMRTNATIGIMGFSYTTGASQMLGWAQSIDALSRGPDGGRYSPDKAMLDIATGLKDVVGTKNVVAGIHARSGEMRHRINNIDRDVSAATRNLSGRNAGFAGGYRKLQAASLRHIGVVQFYMVDVPTWLAAENQALNSGMSATDAVKYADNIIRTSQTAGGVKDLSAIQRQQGMMKAFTMFYSFFNLLYNMEAQAIGETKGAKDIPRLVARASIMLVLPTAMEALLRQQFPEDDENYAQWLALKSFFYGVASVPFARDLVGLAEGFGYSLSPLDSAGETAGKAMAELSKSIDEGEFDADTVKKIIIAGGFLKGYPVTQTKRIWDAFEKWAEDDELAAYDFLIGPPKDK